eukprot:6259735-Ditylum_brightwellii.AAC.1
MKFQAYYERIGSKVQLCVVHLYYHHDLIATQVDHASTFYERFGEEGMLHPAYMSNNDAIGSVDYSKAHPDTISSVVDVSTIILFNLMIAMLGLAAFQLRHIWDGHQCLSDMCSGCICKLLAQGVSTG